MTSTATAGISTPAAIAAPTAESRFDRQLSRILEHAAAVFCERGYEGASMRDLSRASGMSLAGLYHYFDSKEKLLYLLQKHTFTRIMERLNERLEDIANPEQAIRIFILNHLDYFLAHQDAMKVLAHDAEVLQDEYGREVAGLKRDYYRRCLDLLQASKQARGLEFNSRIAVLSLFGMMNWIDTWYNPRSDGDASLLATQMGDIFLSGLAGRRSKAALKQRSSIAAEKRKKHLRIRF